MFSYRICIAQPLPVEHRYHWGISEVEMVTGNSWVWVNLI